MSTLIKLSNIQYTPGSPYVPGTPGSPAKPGYFVTNSYAVKTPIYGWVQTGMRLDWTIIGYQNETFTTKTWVPPVAAVRPTPAVAAVPPTTIELNIGWNAGADTVVSEGGGGSPALLSFQIPRSVVGVVVGLSADPTPDNYLAMPHGIYASHGKLTSIEYGVRSPALFSYSAGDTIGIRRADGKVYYSVGGIVFKTSPSALLGAVRGTASLYMAGDSVEVALLASDVDIGDNGGDTYLRPLRAEGYAGMYAQAVGVIEPLTATAGGRTLDGAAVALQPLFTLAASRAAGFSVVSLALLQSTGSGRQFLARAAVQLAPLASVASDRSYGAAAVVVEPATGNGSAGMIQPDYGASYASMAYLQGFSLGTTGELGSSEVTLPLLSSISADHAYGTSAVTLGPMFSQLGELVDLEGWADLTATSPRLQATARSSAGDNSFVYRTPKPTLSAFGGATAKLKPPSPTLSITATVVNWGHAEIEPPAATLNATGVVSGTAYANLTFGFSNGGSYNLVGYGGAVCSITLTGSPTLQATGTSGSTGRAQITAPLFELTASGIAQNYGDASLLAPAGRLGATAQAWLVAPRARLTAIGTAVVTATYEAYAVNLNHTPKRGVEPVDEATRYTNFPFTHVVRYKSSYFGANSTGLYLLEGTTDDGADISYAVKTATSDLDSPNQKTVASAYFSGRLGPDAAVTLYAGEGAGVPYTYTTPRGGLAQNHRQVFGKGIKQHRYYALGLSGSDAMALDKIELDVKQMNRRI